MDAPAGSAGAGYCLVSGAIAPIDPQAPAIRFQIALPANWNQKVVMLGGGGFEGTIARTSLRTRIIPIRASLRRWLGVTRSLRRMAVTRIREWWIPAPS